MLNLILIWIAISSFLALFVVISLRVSALRSGKEFEIIRSDFYHSAQLFFDHLAFNFVQSIRVIVARALYAIIAWSQVILSWIRKHIVHVEKKVNKVVDVVNGKGEICEAGPVSMFLKEIDIRK